MATFTDVRLRVRRQSAGVDIDIEIDADVSFDGFDLAANQLFQLSWTLLGPDACPVDAGTVDAGTVDGSGKGIGDDMVNGWGTGSPLRFAAEGHPTRTHRLRASIPAAALDEISCGDDGIGALVTLAPVGPFGDCRQSNRVRLPLS